MKKQKEPEASILSVRENITTFIKDLNNILSLEAKEEIENAPERQEANEEAKGVYKPDKPEC